MSDRFRSARERAVPGGTWALDCPAESPAIWGSGDEVIWAEGEPLMVFAPPGVGKTTLAQRLVLARLGVGDRTLLGQPVAPTDRPILYCAIDRPKQARRSLARMVTPADRAALDALLFVQDHPLEFRANDGTALRDFVAELGAGTVVIDSLKDLGVPLLDDEQAIALNQALQHLIAAGVEVVLLHHGRKAQAGNPTPKTLDDVYGSRWLTAGMGSVVALWGRASDPILEFLQLKQPLAEVGPMQVLIDHQRGSFTLAAGGDMLGILNAAPRGLTARDAAAVLYGGEPTKAQIEKARRRLEQLRARNLAHREGGDAIRGAQRASGTYFPIASGGLL